MEEKNNYTMEKKSLPIIKLNYCFPSTLHLWSRVLIGHQNPIQPFSAQRLNLLGTNTIVSAFQLFSDGLQLTGLAHGQHQNE